MWKRNFFFILMVLDICSIFAFSFFSAHSSHVQSQSVTQVLKPVASAVGIQSSDLKEVSSFYHYKDVSLSELVVRKLGHFSEYLLLAIFAGLFGSSLARKKIRLAVMASMGAVIALLDEGVIQLFLSSGRSASVKDVGVDCAGYFTGILLFLLVRRLIRHFTKHRDQLKTSTPAKA